jgi:hypothetical protein
VVAIFWVDYLFSPFETIVKNFDVACSVRERCMPVLSHLKAALVLLLALVLTALFALMLYGVLVLALPKNLIIVAIGFTGVSAVLFGGACLQYFANYFLYDKDDRAELQLLGGVRFGDTVVEAIFSGEGATWPFAKLSASQEALRLQTPFGNYAWERADPRSRGDRPQRVDIKT